MHTSTYMLPNAELDNTLLQDTGFAYRVNISFGNYFRHAVNALMPKMGGLFFFSTFNFNIFFKNFVRQSKLSALAWVHFADAQKLIKLLQIQNAVGPLKIITTTPFPS